MTQNKSNFRIGTRALLVVLTIAVGVVFAAPPVKDTLIITA